MPVVVVSDRSHRFGMIVDEFLGERDLEVRPLDPRLGKPPDINSASVLDDGWPVLIVDVEDLVRSIDNLLGGKPAPVDAAARRSRRGRRGRSSESWSWTTRSPSASWSGNCWRAGATPSTWRSTASTAGTPSGSGDYRLVISDVDMPRMDGISLVRSIKAGRRGSSPSRW